VPANRLLDWLKHRPSVHLPSRSRTLRGLARRCCTPAVFLARCVIASPTTMKKRTSVIFGKRLRALRTIADYNTARAFAAHLGIDENTLTRWERRETEPDIEMILRICQVLEISPSELLLGKPSTRRD